MATTAQGRALTEAHRLQQVQFRAAVVRELLGLRPALDPERFADTWPAVARAVTAIIDARRPLSARAADAYYRTLRQVEGTPGTFTPTLASGAARAAVSTSLDVTGPATFARGLATGHTARESADTVWTRVAGSAARHVLNGGRQTLVSAIREDGQALGWERVTDASPCAFCALLAGRGAVYKTEVTGGFRSHDHCGCTVEPRFLGDDRISSRNRQFRDAYREASRGESDQLNAFRRSMTG